MKYGINIVEGQLKAISEFVDGNELPKGFEAVTKERYDELLEKATGFTKWDENLSDLVVDQNMIDSFQKQTEILNVKQKLSSVLSDLILAERLGENTTVLQKKFDDLSKEYKANKNIPPVVYAGKKQTIALPNNSTELLGKATDRDGKIVSVNWSKISGGKAKIANPNKLSTKVKDLEAGNYIFKLTATDNKGASAASNVTIYVKPKETIKISTSPKEKLNISSLGTTFEVNVKSNTEWYALGKGNSSVSPSSGRGNEKVTVRIHRNNSGGPLKGIVEFKAEDKVFNLIWSQKGERNEDDDDYDGVGCFDLESDVTLANGRSKKLKNIKVGDKLRGYNFPNRIDANSDTYTKWSGMLKEATITDVEVKDMLVKTVDSYVELTMIDETVLNITKDHPLLVSKDKKEVSWVKPSELRSGLFLIDKDGKTQEIESKKTIRKKLEIGVLDVENIDNYMIQGFIVHNAEIIRNRNQQPIDVIK
ncbi:PKD domain-containing protein [Aquimarina aggregata]|uniref:PKD domain-containing protein n=1 Tax=Aquimarina aggregata TaxID=1642818 RepID=UPI00249326D4|nr:hypothetical protein [Aquimarina aggregata]